MSTVASILSTDIVSASRSTINTNFGNLNSTKVEFVNIINLLNQQADISLTTAFTPSVSGLYFVGCKRYLTQAATVSSTCPSVNLFWAAEDTGVSHSTVMVSSSTGNNLGTTWGSASLSCVSFKAGVPVQYSTSGYASSGATPMKYSLSFIFLPVTPPTT